MTNIETLKNSIKEELETLSSIEKVYSYESGIIEGYPVAQVSSYNFSSSLSSNISNLDLFRFRIRVLHPHTGKEEESERAVNTVVFDIINLFEDPETMKPIVQFIKINEAVFGYLENGNKRICDIILECQLDREYI